MNSETNKNNALISQLRLLQADIPIIPLPPGWSQLHNKVISLNCFTRNLKNYLWDYIIKFV